MILKKKGAVKVLAAAIALAFGIGTIGLSDVLTNIFYGYADEFTESAVEFTNATGEMEVTYFDVGQGDCTIIETEGHVMMIDTGENNSGYRVADYLEQEGIAYLDYLILTHPDSDHIGGADNVIETAEIGAILMPDMKNDTVTYEELMKDIEKYQIEMIHPQPKEIYSLGDAKFVVLSSEPEAYEDGRPVNFSVSIQLVHGENSFVFTGDAERQAELAMIDRFGEGLECDVLKCGHHGNSRATSDEFLVMTDPQWAVISCGLNNDYGHPHAETLDKLDRDDVIVYRTDTMGTIRALSDGENLYWSCER